MSLPSMQRIRNGGRGLIAALLLLGCLAGCQKKNQYAAPPPPLVTVRKPLQQAVTEYAQFNGLTEAVESVQIRARVEGYLENVHFQAGARVRRGDLLFVIDPRPFRAKLDEAMAELARRQAELKQTAATLQRKELAFRANAVSEVEVIQARADRDVAKAAIEAARAAIETARLNLSYTRIEAPISGRIGRRLVDAGNLVGAGERTLLTTIVQDDPIYVYFNVSERELLYYQKYHSPHADPTNGDGETPVYLGLSNQQDYPYRGRIDFVDNRLDPDTGTVQVRGVFANPRHLLWPGLFARIRVPVNIRQEALLVPEAALGTDQRGDYLLVVNADNVAEYRPVTTGPRVKNLRVIEAGLAATDRVIVDGLQRARPGLPVKVVAAAAQAAAAAPPSSPTRHGGGSR